MRYMVTLRFDTEADAETALAAFRVYDGDWDRWSWDESRVTTTEDVPAPLPSGFWVNLLFNDNSPDIQTYEALAAWICTATNGFGQWTVIRNATGYDGIVPPNAFT